MRPAFCRVPRRSVSSRCAIPTNRDGYVAGGQVGYNFQSGAWVWGVEADFSRHRHRGLEHGDDHVIGFAFPNTSSVSQEMEWFGTLRGRIGLCRQQLAVLRYRRSRLRQREIHLLADQRDRFGAINIFGSQSDVEVGWTLGGGIEYGFGPWSVKGEYLYYDLGDHHVLGSAQSRADRAVQSEFRERGSIVRAAFNYRFR